VRKLRSLANHFFGVFLMASLAVALTPATAATKKQTTVEKKHKAVSKSKAVVASKAVAKKAKPKLVVRNKDSKNRFVAKKASKANKAARATAHRSERGQPTRVGSAAKVREKVRTMTQSTASRKSNIATVNYQRNQAKGDRWQSGPTVIASPALANSSNKSFGQIYGLHQTQDPLALKSSVALVIDQDTHEVLVSKNSDAILPIASITKLMTAMVIVEADQPMQDILEVTQADVDTEKNSRSRLAVGTTLTRGEALHLALMSSENRAAHVLGRYYPGGLSAFVREMNRKSKALGMLDSHFVDPTGLNSQNQSSAQDLAVLVSAASAKSMIRHLSVSQGYALQSGSRIVEFHNTNGLVSDPEWDIGLQKTGYIVEAGRCLVLQARVIGRRVIMVFLDSSGRYSRLADAKRVRRWLEESQHQAIHSYNHLPAAESSSSIFISKSTL